MKNLDCPAMGSLETVRLKLVRAEEHFKAIVDLLGRFSIGDCEIRPEENKKTHMAFLRVQLPEQPEQLPVVIGEFRYHVRSCLDHLVYDLVTPDQAGGVKDKTAFPICDTPGAFEAQKKRHRLDGIPARAVTIIESLQPYEGRSKALRVLSTLHERDKHKTLNLMTAVASDTRIDWTSGDTSFLQMFLGGEELHNGAILGNVMMPLTQDVLDLLESSEPL